MKEELINQFITRNGFTAERAEELANLNEELVSRMKEAIVKFYFTKVDGSMREAYGTLREDLLPELKGGRSTPANDTVQVYFDTEKESWRSFKRANLVKIA